MSLLIDQMMESLRNTSENSVSISEFTLATSAITRLVHENKKEILITKRGIAVIKLVPIT